MKEIKTSQISQDQNKDAIKRQLKYQEQKLDCTISDLKSQMKTWIGGTLEDKVGKRTGGGGVKRTV